MVRTVAFCGISPNFLAIAASEAPVEIPPKIPSSFANLCAKLNASSFPTRMAPYRISVFKTAGMKPAPIPWIACGPGAPPLMTGDCSGSTAKALS